MDKTNKAYISSLINRKSELYGFKTEQRANEVPAITDEALQLIKVMITATGAKKILEIGTATGSSSMFFASFIGSDADITTLERDDAFYIKAGRNVETKGYADNIRILHGDAKEILSELNDSFDLIFMDGAKAQYINMLPDCIRLLKKGGLLVADNVLFRGMVSEQNPVIRRKITIVKRLRAFLEAITSCDELITSVIDAGDGVSISVKK